MSNSPPGPGPDLFFAGGECLTRFGVWVRRTDMDLEEATGEIFSRNSDAEAIGRDGILRTWRQNLPRAEWLNEVDLDATRNLLDPSDIGLWGPFNGATVERITPTETIVGDDSTVFTGVVLLDFNVAGPSRQFTVSCLLRRDLESTTFNLRLALDLFFDVAVDPATGEFIAHGAGAHDAVSVTRAGAYWRVTITATGASTALPQVDVYGAWNKNGELNAVADALAIGENIIKEIQCEFSDSPTKFQQIPRDTDRKFPSLLLELARTNAWTNSESMGVDWNFSRTGLIADIGTAPDGSATPDRIFEDATDGIHSASRALPTHTANSQSVSGYVKAAGRTSVLMQMSDGADTVEVTLDLATGTFVGADSGAGAFQNATLEELPDGWFRWTLTGVISGLSVGGTFSCILVNENGLLSYPGDGSSGVDAWGWQFEVDVAPSSSYIETGGVTVTREQDTFSGAFPHPPVGMTVYAKFIESGTSANASFRQILFVGGSFGDVPRLRLEGDSTTFYRTFYHNGSDEVNSQQAVAPNVGDLVELRVILFADGSIDLGQSINGGVETLGGRSRPITLAAAWGGDFLSINGTADGSVGLQRNLALKAQRGVRTLDFMRAL